MQSLLNLKSFVAILLVLAIPGALLVAYFRNYSPEAGGHEHAAGGDSHGMEKGHDMNASGASPDKSMPSHDGMAAGEKNKMPASMGHDNMKAAATAAPSPVEEFGPPAVMHIGAKGFFLDRPQTFTPRADQAKTFAAIKERSAMEMMASDKSGRRSRAFGSSRRPTVLISPKSKRKPAKSKSFAPTSASPSSGRWPRQRISLRLNKRKSSFGRIPARSPRPRNQPRPPRRPDKQPSLRTNISTACRHSFSSESETSTIIQKSTMKILLKISVLGLAALLTCGPLAAADSMTESLRPLKGAEFEQSFLTHMIHHHQEGIVMAKMVPHHTKRAELTDFAEKMTKTQMADIEKMSALLESPAGSSTAKMDHSKMRDKKMDHAKTDGAMSGMGQMGSAQGPEFDRMFVQEMIKHHTLALEMAELVEGRASRAEVIGIAKKITKEQKDEIQKLTSWEAKWVK